ncbi:MAG TPA: FlgD immunoglobulin-like domain containing protein [Candidatus Krumholzibacteria bacterium]|nr:FlgD immunoglobulin-like domain containing protein [Candidatus Krumholzibacteria bacterium]HRX51958.1 FlgD immunoglobulin-like domain containing protein [Candidatus Krumholzibacteria bacterium]
MRRRALASLLVTILISTAPALAQTCLDYAAFPSALGAEPAPAGALDHVIAVGQVLYAASGSDLVIFDLTDPLAPTRILTLSQPGAVAAMCTAAGRLYLAVDDLGVRVYDLSDPIVPSPVHDIPHHGLSGFLEVSGVAAAGDLLAVCESGEPVRLLDMSVPTEPVEVGLITISSQHAALADDLLALTGSTFVLFDVSDPSAPQLLAQEIYVNGAPWHSLTFGRPVLHQGLALAERRLAESWRDPYIYGDRIYPIYTLATLGADKAFADTDKILGGRPANPALLCGDILYLADEFSDHAAYPLDAAGPTGERRRLPLLAELRGLAEVDGLLYAATERGLIVTSVPDGSVEANVVPPPSVGQGLAEPLALNRRGDDLYALMDLVGEYEMGPGWYVRSSFHEVQRVFEAQIVGRLVLPIDSFDFAAWGRTEVFGDRLAVATDLGLYLGLLPEAGQELTATAFGVPSFTSVARAGAALYLAEAAGGVRVLDMTDASAPSDLGVLWPAERPDDLAVLGDRLYLRFGSELGVADVSAPLSPVLLAGRSVVPAGRLEARGGLLGVATADGGFAWSPVADPDAPAFGAPVPLEFPVLDWEASGDLIYLADAAGIALLDPGAGTIEGRALLPGLRHLRLDGPGLTGLVQGYGIPAPLPLDCRDPLPLDPGNETPLPTMAPLSMRPNPFNPATEIVFRTEVPGSVRVTVLDLSGRRVALLADGPLPAAEHRLTWRGRDDAGHGVPSGTYVVRVESADGRRTGKITLLR